MPWVVAPVMEIHQEESSGMVSWQNFIVLRSYALEGVTYSCKLYMYII